MTTSPQTVLTKDNSDYFTIKPKLSLDTRHSSDLEESESEDNDEMRSLDGSLTGMLTALDHVSISTEPNYRTDSCYYSPLTPLDVTDNSNDLSSPKTSLVPESLHASSLPLTPSPHPHPHPITKPSCSQRSSTFFPPSSASSSASSLSPSPPSPVDFRLSLPNLQPLKFLIVDDNIINLKLLNRVLAKLYPKSQITQVLDSSKVEELVIHNSYDSIFIDIEMPIVNGIQIAQFIRGDSTRDNIALIAVTTRTTTNDLQLFTQTGIDFTFGKPLNYKMDFMANKIDSVMSARRNSTSSTNPIALDSNNLKQSLLTI
ncbi:SRR1 [Candida oxycetoniae]|uniref:SRR1 n=1 Tax=Candida oxycetoniae TaxID=497107 RepID=A0AAI9WZB6_9ASCO|nr:SRR1 [Candida oxycetoniae]KAI3405889.2 SRR1 [Candida oxycetoniae]